MAQERPPYLIRDEDRRLFKRCRRAWDFGSTMRCNLEPRWPDPPFDLERALHDALAIYYFPGMWNWNRTIVYPRVLEAFENSMREQRRLAEAERRLTPQQSRAWQEQLELGLGMLGNYFRWAPTVDRFTPAWVSAEFDVGIPDPASPGAELVTPSGRRILYRDRIEALVQDDDSAYWLLDHRVVGGPWEDVAQLLIDERSQAHAWAWEQDFVGWRVAGVIFNQLRAAHPPAGDAGALATSAQPAADPEPAGRRRPRRRVLGRAPEGSGPRLAEAGNQYFRRTRVRRSRRELEAAGRQLAVEAAEMCAREVPVYPSPSAAHCPACPYREPCAALFAGEDPAASLAGGCRERGEGTYEAWRLGSRRMGFSRGALPPSWG